MADILTNGVRIHYERTGGDKPPLILCHGITDTGQCWPLVVDALRKDYDLILPDARGHGLSAAPESGYTYANLAADVAGLIRGLGLKKPGIMGHSMGAMTAAVVGADYRDLPRCLVLEDPPWREGEQSAAQKAAHHTEWRAQVVGRKAASAEQMIEERKRELWPEVWADAEFAPWVAAKKMVSLDVLSIIEAEAPSYRDLVSRITCPTLLITADPARGAIVTPQVAQDVARLNPKIHVVTIKNAGHNIRRANFHEYIAAVTAFLKENLR